MAYGFLAKNANDETVINDSEPLFVQKRSGSRFHKKRFGGTSAYNLADEMYTTGHEILFIKLDVGSWIGFSPIATTEVPTGKEEPTGTTFFDYQFYSNQQKVEWSVFAPRDTLNNPTGYGMAVYNSQGKCVWDSKSLVARIVNGNTIISSQIGSASNPNTATGGNAVTAGIGNASVRLGGAEAFWMTVAHRKYQDKWLIYKKLVYGSETGHGVMAEFKSDYSCLFALV